jgi:hypothetical protein
VDELAEQRFWSKVDTSAGPDECWLWMAARAGGYGRFAIAGKLRQAHHVAFELVTGEPIGAPYLGHTRFNKACVNPAHLKLMTKRECNENRAGPQRNSRSGVRNVSRRGKRWHVRVGHNGGSVYVGMFDSLAEADAAARAKRNALFTANFSDRAVSALTQG